MTEDGFSLLEKAFRLENVERAPWVPFVGVHGGYLIGVDAETYLKSSKHIVSGVSKAIELYQPDGIPVLFDLQVEAEILGCKLVWSKDGPPAVDSHPLAEGVSLNDLSVPEETDGRIPLVLKSASELKKAYPEIGLYGLLTGPFTLALHLAGTDIFMKLFLEPDYVQELMEFCTKVAIRYSDMLMDNGCDVVAVVDPMTSQIDSDSFQNFVSPFAKEIFDHVRHRQKYSSFFVCGQAQQNIEVMCETGPDNVSIDENIPLGFVKNTALNKGVSFGGNIKLTSVLLLGDEMDAKKETVNCIDEGGKRGFILAPGCDLQMETPVANLQAVSEVVHDEYVQQVAREIEHTSNIELLDLNKHWIAGKVVVDVITLDSASCAPCQYMVEAVKQAAEPLKDKVIVNEFKIKDKKGLQMMMTLGIKNVPTTCINGQVAFISQIPQRSEIEKLLRKAIEE